MTTDPDHNKKYRQNQTQLTVWLPDALAKRLRHHRETTGIATVETVRGLLDGYLPGLATTEDSSGVRL